MKGSHRMSWKAAIGGHGKQLLKVMEGSHWSSHRRSWKAVIVVVAVVAVVTVVVIIVAVAVLPYIVGSRVDRAGR